MKESKTPNEDLLRSFIQDCNNSMIRINTTFELGIIDSTTVNSGSQEFVGQISIYLVKGNANTTSERTLSFMWGYAAKTLEDLPIVREGFCKIALLDIIKSGVIMTARTNKDRWDDRNNLHRTLDLISSERPLTPDDAFKFAEFPFKVQKVEVVESVEKIKDYYGTSFDYFKFGSGWINSSDRYLVREDNEIFKILEVRRNPNEDKSLVRMIHMNNITFPKYTTVGQRFVVDNNNNLYEDDSK